MKPVRLLIVITAFVLFAHAARAQQLWGPTQWGMSIQEVKQAVPQAQPPAKPFQTDDGQLLLELRGVEVVNQKFSVSFYFKSDRLESVQVSADPSPQTSEVAYRMFSDLVVALRAKYGSAIYVRLSPDHKTGMAKWLNGRTNILLNLMDVGLLIVAIDYSVPGASDANKL